MLIELSIAAAVGCIVVAVVTIYQRRQDVLHGPYIDRDCPDRERRA